MNAVISETTNANKLGEISVMFHAHSNAHKPPKTVASTVQVLQKSFY